MHLLEEIAALGPARVVVVYHPYYEQFAAWARQILSEHGQARYARLTGQHAGPVLPPGQAITFVPQRGPYADLTSVINGADHLGWPNNLYVAFADNLYQGISPLLALSATPPGQVIVLARPYQPELAGSHGVITATGPPGRRLLASLTEKPGPARAQELERHHGRRNLFLLEGRARLTAAFTDSTRDRTTAFGREPKLSLAIAAWARTYPVRIVETTAGVIDLGALAPRQPDIAARQQKLIAP